MADLVSASAQAIADALAPTPQAPAARWRWGSVVSVNADGTMNVSIGGATVPSVRCAQHVMGAQVGDRVRVLYCGTECMVDAVRAVDGPTPTDTGWRTLAGNAPTKDNHINGMRIRRIGSTVQFDLRAGGAWNDGTIGTGGKTLTNAIPAGYRPLSYIQFPGSVPGADVRCYMAVNADTGAATVWCSSNSFYYTFSTVWLTDDDWPE